MKLLFLVALLQVSVAAPQPPAPSSYGPMSSEAKAAWVGVVVSALAAGFAWLEAGKSRRAAEDAKAASAKSEADRNAQEAPRTRLLKEDLWMIGGGAARLSISIVNDSRLADGIESVRVIVHNRGNPELLPENNRKLLMEDNILVRSVPEVFDADPDDPGTWRHVLPQSLAPLTPLVFVMHCRLPWGVKWENQGLKFSGWSFRLEVDCLRGEKIVKEISMWRSPTDAERLFPEMSVGAPPLNPPGATS